METCGGSPGTTTAFIGWRFCGRERTFDSLAIVTVKLCAAGSGLEYKVSMKQLREAKKIRQLVGFVHARPAGPIEKLGRLAH